MQFSCLSQSILVVGSYFHVDLDLDFTKSTSRCKRSGLFGLLSKVTMPHISSCIWFSAQTVQLPFASSFFNQLSMVWQYGCADDEQNVQDRRSIVAPHLYCGEMYMSICEVTSSLTMVLYNPHMKDLRRFLKEQFWIQWLCLECKRTVKSFMQLASCTPQAVIVVVFERS